MFGSCVVRFDVVLIGPVECPEASRSPPTILQIVLLD